MSSKQGLVETEPENDFSELLLESEFFEAMNDKKFAEYVETFISGSNWNSDSIPRQNSDNLSDHSIEQQIFRGAIASLYFFVQQNWTGPPITDEISNNEHLCHIVDRYVCHDLDVDGEYCNRSVQLPGLLFIAYQILVQKYEDFCQYSVASFWALRTISVYQRVLSGRSPSLEKMAYSVISSCLSLEELGIETEGLSGVENSSQLEMTLWLRNDFIENNAKLRCLFLLEVSIFSLSAFDIPMETIGFNPKMTGRLGRKTKYQEQPLAQLWVSSDSGKSFKSKDLTQNTNRTQETVGSSDEKVVEYFPPNIELKDSDLLGATVFEDTPEEEKPIDVLGQLLLVTDTFISMKTGSSEDQLADETARTTVERLITDPSCKNSSIRTLCFIIRNFLEESRGKNLTVPKASERMKYIFSLPLPPQVELQRLFAMFLGKMGLVKNAMDIFESLQRWEDLIDCCCLTGHISRALDLVDDRLGKESDVMSRARLYCVRGDLTRDEKYYLEAWNVSERRFARAKRSLGRLQMKNCQWSLATQSFLESLRINALYPEIWFSLAYCAQKIDDYSLAANALTRVIQQQPDNGEAWNNLASIYVQLNKKKEAVFALSEAVKHKRESWKIWENLLMVALSVGDETTQVVYAMETLLELRGRDGIYSEQLLHLVNQVISCFDGKDGDQSRRTLKRMLELLGRITSMVSSDPNVWEATAKLHHVAGYKDREIIALQKQIRCMSSHSWWQSEASLKKMLNATFSLNELCLDTGDEASCYSAKLHLDKIMSKCKELELETSLLQELEQDLDRLEKKLFALSRVDV
eukprot:jgi/Galph1/3596/GphlegSOOS_G2264.1